MILPYFIIIPLLSAFLISLIAGKNDYWAVLLSTVAVFSLFILSLYCAVFQISETVIYEMGRWPVPFGINLVQDALTSLMLVMVSLIALTSLLYSIQYIRLIERNWKYYSLFMLLVTGMNGVIITGDLFNIFVFMEIALFSAFALVCYGGKAEEYEAAFKYAIMGSLSASIVLLGITILYSGTSALTLGVLATKIPGLHPALVFWIGCLFMVGFGFKAAIIPFHAWLPDAHSSAPATISAMLSGVLIKVLGIYVLIRLFFNVFNGLQIFLDIFLVLGMVSILVGVLLALGQWDIKRLLAYHSISQIGYILIGMGLGTEWGILGAVFHLLNHAIFKSLLFYNAGVLETVTGTRDLRKMGNITKSYPVASSTSLVASLSISGIPPFNGFFSKLILIFAAIQASQFPCAMVAVAGSILTLASFLKVQRYGFRGVSKVEPGKNPIGLQMNAAMVILAVLCLATSLLILPGIREVTLDPVVKVILNKANYAQTVIGR